MFRRASIALLVLALRICPGAAADADLGQGFGYCAPAYPPGCMTAPDTLKTPATTSVCEAEVDRYIASLAAYRACLLVASQRAIAAGNDDLSAWRCRTGHVERCLLK